MSKNTLRQTLDQLADAIESQTQNSALANPLAFVEQLPKRSLTGDHINGGKILKFSSSGITDSASKEQILIKDDGVTIATVKIGKVLNDLTVEGTVSASALKVDVLEVKELKADIKFEKDTSIIFSGDNISGKGLLWTGQGYTKQLVYNSNPDRLFSSETIDLGKGKSLSINGVTVLDSQELGPSITKSSLREVGRLKGLIVDGSISVDQYLFYNSTSNRLGLGTEEPNASLSVVEDGVEMLLGTKDSTRGVVGTFASHSVDIVTDNTSRISISAGGNISLGNNKTPPVQVSVHGKLAIKVNSPDPEVDLHVSGSIKYDGHLQKYDRSYPISGSYNAGDMVWNTEPKMNSYVGWVCIQAGSPGIWAPFGKIGNQ